jgi:hypothetical protein
MELKSFSAETTNQFKDEFQQIENQGFIASTAIIFASVNVDLDEISKFLEAHSVQVFGCSSCGEFLYDEQSQILSEEAIVCLLVKYTSPNFRLKSFEGEQKTSFLLGTEIGDWAKNIFADPAIIIVASGLETDGEQLVKGIQSSAGENITMFGGLAGDDAKFKDTFVFSEGRLLKNGALIMLLDKNDFDVKGIATSGWVGIGADKIITHSEGNVVYTIDDQPALNVYKEYLNVDDKDLPEIGVEYPLLIKKPGKEDVLRAVLNVDREKKSLIFAGTVPQGATVTFSSSPGFEVVEFTRNKVIAFYEKNKQADYLILFSCMARHNALGPMISEEIDQAWGNWNIPLIGFFTYGEIGNNYNSTCDFYNETFTLVSIKEK